MIPAFIIGTITGILFGIIAAKNRGKTIDSVISFFANIGVSMPMFWLGMMGMLVFALKLRVLPSSGYVPITRDFGGWLSHMIMPIIVLSLGVNAGFVRLTRSSMLEVLREDYVRKMEAKLEQWNAEIDTLVVKAALAEAELKTEYSEQIEALRNKQIEARVKLEALRDASDEAWKDMRAGIEMAWDSVSEAVNSALSRFK